MVFHDGFLRHFEVTGKYNARNEQNGIASNTFSRLDWKRFKLLTTLDLEALAHPFSTAGKKFPPSHPWYRSRADTDDPCPCRSDIPSLLPPGGSGIHLIDSLRTGPGDGDRHLAGGYHLIRRTGGSEQPRS